MPVITVVFADPALCLIDIAVDLRLRIPIYLIPIMAIHENNPLPPAALHVLLALAAQDLHGYGILREISQISGGEYRVGPGMLYDNLMKLLNLGWVEDYESDGAEGAEQKRMYHLTDAGRLVLAADVRKMKRVVRVANSRLGAEGGQP